MGIGVSSPNAQLQFTNTPINRKIVLYELSNNDNEYYGFGINNLATRYQVGSLTADHVFYAGNGPFASNELFRIKGNGNIGIGTSSPTAQLQLANIISNRKIVLYDANNNDHQFSGLGINNDAVRYQTASTTTDHAFYAGASTTSSVELMRIKGTGRVGIGTSNPTPGLTRCW
ncbi:MAG: hypothetical protein IPP93_08090 [Chitinophagaceae bacterium]|nr:hypothetical protein [Chitinophagaceae bacterium]